LSRHEHRSISGFRCWIWTDAVSHVLACLAELTIFITQPLHVYVNFDIYPELNKIVNLQTRCVMDDRPESNPPGLEHRFIHIPSREYGLMYPVDPEQLQPFQIRCFPDPEWCLLSIANSTPLNNASGESFQISAGTAISIIKGL